MKKKIACLFVIVLMATNIEGCSKSNDSEAVAETSTVSEVPVDTSEAEEEIVAENAIVDDLTAENADENEETEDEVKELPIPELLKHVDITDVLSLYNSSWDAYIVLSNDYNNLLCYNLWNECFGTDHIFDKTIIDKLGLEEDEYFRICSDTDALSDTLLGVNSNYYCISSFFAGLSWNNLYYESSCTVEECVQLFSKSGYSDIEVEDLKAEISTYNVISGKKYSNNILWTVKVLLNHDMVQYIFFVPEGGIKNAPIFDWDTDRRYSYSILNSLEYQEGKSTCIIFSLDDFTLKQGKSAIDFSNDEIKCSETFTGYANADLIFKTGYIGKGRYKIGYTQDSDGLICGYDILDDGITLCGLRLGEKVENDHVISVAGLRDYYTVRQSEGYIDYLISYKVYAGPKWIDWYLCIRLDSANTVKGISLLRNDVCIFN